VVTVVIIAFLGLVMAIYAFEFTSNERLQNKIQEEAAAKLREKYHKVRNQVHPEWGGRTPWEVGIRKPGDQPYPQFRKKSPPGDATSSKQ